MESEISEFYRDRCVFITGATGFMGKVLVEKLLRSCPNVKHLYLLMRPKRGVPIQTRLQDFTNAKLFDVLRKDHPQSFDKLIPIDGDISLPGLGICEEDLKMLKANASVVFHLAATIRFNEKLKVAAQINIKGTAEIIEICKILDTFKAFVHVSTAYANCVRGEVDEKIYLSATQVDNLRKLTDDVHANLSPDEEKSMIGDYPNTYTFTKFMAELLLLKECDGKMPLSIIRPSIVTASLKEPIPGWIDNINGPTGIIFGHGRGFLRTMYVSDNCIDFVPVDYSTNLMIAAAWYSATYKPSETVVYHSATGDLNPFTTKESCRLTLEMNLKFPYTEMLWYPIANLATNRLVHKTHKIFYHYIPAYVMDFFIRIIGNKPSLVKIYTAADRGMSSYDYFWTNTWRFKTSNWEYIFHKMNPHDRNEFNFDFSSINMRSYFATFCSGVRRFIQKDEISTLPMARSKLRRLRILHQVFLSFLFFMLTYFLYISTPIFAIV